jgi:hypothetical protein
VVKDDAGVKWKIKLGPEAKPETVATRLVWAAGYIADEDYFLPTLRVTELPASLHRGRGLVGADGTMHDARLKRDVQRPDRCRPVALETGSLQRNAGTKRVESPDGAHQQLGSQGRQQ